VIFGGSGLIRGVIFGGSGLIRGVIFGGSGLIRGVIYGGSGHIRGVIFGGSGHIRGVIFGGSGLIRGGRLYTNKYKMCKQQSFIMQICDLFMSIFFIFKVEQKHEPEHVLFLSVRETPQKLLLVMIKHVVS
jgi:hypothetical protein